MGNQLSTLKANGPPYKISALGRDLMAEETDPSSKFQSSIITISPPGTRRPLSPTGDYPTEPTFLGITLELRTRILSLAGLPSRRELLPYYNEGSVHIRGFDDSQRGPLNIPTALLLISRSVYEEARQMLYSTNRFTFRDPHLALWFYKRIGRTNCLKVQNMAFVLTTGYPDGASERHDKLSRWMLDDGPEEKLWKELVEYVGKRVEPMRLAVSFEAWLPHYGADLDRRTGDMVPSHDSVGRPFYRYSEEQFEELEAWRRKVVEGLMKWRVMEEAGSVDIRRGVFFKHPEAEVLAASIKWAFEDAGEETEEETEGDEEGTVVMEDEDIGVENEREDKYVEMEDAVLELPASLKALVAKIGAGFEASLE